MGRRHRSSSWGNNGNATGAGYGTAKSPSVTPGSSSSSAQAAAAAAPPLDLAACHALLQHFVHGKDHDGRTVLHRAIEMASSSSSSSAAAATSVEEDPSSSSTSLHEDYEKLDGLHLIEALSTRLKEFDMVAASIQAKGSSGKQHQQQQHQQQQRKSHYHQLMLTHDDESGYTPLHYAILKRDLIALLVLLKHASCSMDYSDYPKFLSGGGRRSLSSSSNVPQQHPLRLLDGSNTAATTMMDNTAATRGGGGGGAAAESSNPSNIIGDIASALDRERLTPLQLLGRTSAGGLEECRRSLRWKSLRRVWKQEQQTRQRRRRGGGGGERRMSFFESGGGSRPDDRRSDDGNNNNNPQTNRRYRGRRRMISFGDERDYDTYEIDHDNDDAEDHHRASSEREGRGRSGSFNHVHLDEDVPPEEDDDDDDNGGRTHNEARNNNDLMPLENVDFGVLAGNNNNEDDDGDTAHNEREHRPPTSSSSNTIVPPRRPIDEANDDYGCEVLTFGRADHCALGVPQFTTLGGRGARGGGMSDDKLSSSGGGATTTATTSYKPKRVETFALGELRRGWSSSFDPGNGSGSDDGDDDSLLSATTSKPQRRDAVDSPAVAVAASAHHTLVSTRSGRLYSFGLGRGGRLGTGDENHRPLPARVLGPLAHRIVASIAAATNHSLCSTSEGDVYAWGSNGFGQLGIVSSSSSSDGNKTTDGGNNGSNNNAANGRLSPRRVEGELKHLFVVAVAAGDRHSVALTRMGEVYCWGDNRSGQLGTYISASTGATTATSPSSSQANNAGRSCHRPQRVESLWSAQPRRRAIAIAAAEFSTLVLTMPPTMSANTGEASSSSLASLPVNTIYGWGHGNHSPMRVNFPSVGGGMNGMLNKNNNNNLSSSTAGMQEGVNSSYVRFICTNPVAIACAKYHNVAITADGRVYSWGMHSESLGIEKKKSSVVTPSKANDFEWTTSEGHRRQRSQSIGSSSSSSASSAKISSPQLVVGMLPENTRSGHAVAVSASESHTAVVTSDGHLYTWGTSHDNDVLGHKGVRWQPIPRRVGRVHRAVGVAAGKEHTVLLMGVSFPPLPFRRSCGALLAAESSVGKDRCRPLSLQDCASRNVARNVDLFNVIPVALIAHRLNSRSLMSFCDEFVRRNLDGVLAVGNKNDFSTFLSSRAIVGARNFESDGPFHPFLYHLANSKGWMANGRSLLNRCVGSRLLRSKKQGKRTKREDQGKSVVKTAKPANERTRILKEEEKPNMKETETVRPNENEEPHTPRKLFQEKMTKGNATPTKYHCDVCGISCPDSDSYTFHINGRKHRNRLMHAKSEEEKKVAESMMAMKRMQLMENGSFACHDPRIEEVKDPSETIAAKSAWSTPKATATPVVAKRSSEKKPRSKSFQDILQEEHKRSSEAQAKFPSPIASKPRALSSTGAVATFPMKLYPQPAIAYSVKKPSPLTAQGQSVPLSAFMKKSAPPMQDAMSSIGANWGAKSNKNNSGVSWGATAPKRKPVLLKKAQAAPSKMKSFSEIQQEEEAKANKEDHMCRIDGNQWFVQQRERAASIGEIQENEKRDQEMQEMIEEQKQIEEEIMRRVKQEENARKQQDKKKKKQNGRKKTKKPANAKSKKSPASSKQNVYK